jgi:hypothetical protein
VKIEMGILDLISQFRYRMRVKLLHAIYMEKNKIMKKNQAMYNENKIKKQVQTDIKTVPEKEFKSKRGHL